MKANQFNKTIFIILIIGIVFLTCQVYPHSGGGFDLAAFLVFVFTPLFLAFFGLSHSPRMNIIQSNSFNFHLRAPPVNLRIR